MTDNTSLAAARAFLAERGFVDGFTVEQAETDRTLVAVDALRMLHTVADALTKPAVPDVRDCCEAERERCAKIASEWAGDTINDNHLRIATAIRGADQ